MNKRKCLHTHEGNPIARDCVCNVSFWVGGIVVRCKDRSSISTVYRWKWCRRLNWLYKLYLRAQPPQNYTSICMLRGIEVISCIYLLSIPVLLMHISVVKPQRGTSYTHNDVDVVLWENKSYYTMKGLKVMVRLRDVVALNNQPSSKTSFKWCLLESPVQETIAKVALHMRCDAIQLVDKHIVSK